MQRSFLVLSAVLLLLVAAPVVALERTLAMRGDRALPDDWAAGTTCSVSYYNTCTGWLWIWSGWSATDTIGQVFEPCCAGGSATMLAATTVYAWTGAPGPCYGFTGTITVSQADGSGCPAGVLAQQVLLPRSGANTHVWNLPVTGNVVVTVENASEYGLPNPTAWASDHPAAGPTGPAACGFCFPTSRPIHSYYYGKANTALCPGSPLDDGVCNAEWLLWAASFRCTVSVEPQTWAGVKNLYR